MYQQLEEMMVWRTPQVAVIKDKRLWAIQTALTVGVFILCIYMIAGDNHAYEEVLYPQGAVSFWGGSGDALAVQQAFASGESVPNYCSDRRYWVADGTYWLYHHYQCIAPSMNEFIQKDPNQFFFLSQFDDTHVRRGSCDVVTAADCTATNLASEYSFTYDTVGDECVCSKKQSYFAIGTEEMTFSIDTNIWVDKDGETLFQTGSSKVVTKVKDTHGNIRYTFQPGEILTLTVSEWLEVAGVDSLDVLNPLINIGTTAVWMCGSEDWDDPEVAAFEPCENDFEGVYYRTSGIMLYVQIYYQGRQGEMEAIISVSVGANWQGMGSKISYMDYPELQTAWGEYGTGETTNSQYYIDRYRYGVRFQMKIVGEVNRFDWYTLQNSLIAACVYLQLVPVLVLFIASYGFKHSDAYKAHIENEGQLEQCIEERKKASQLFNQINANLSPQKQKTLNRKVWLELAISEGFSSDPQELWPFEETSVSNQTLIRTAEADPNTPFARTVQEFLGKADAIAERFFVEFHSYPHLNDIYEYNKVQKKFFSPKTNGVLEYEANFLMKNGGFYKLVVDSLSLMSTSGKIFPVGTHMWESKNTNNKTTITLTPSYGQKETADIILQIFHRFDEDHNNCITFPEFQKMLQTWSKRLSTYQIQKLWDEMDTNHDNIVTVEEMIAFMGPAVDKMPQVQGLQKIIQLCFDESMNTSDLPLGWEERVDQKSGRKYWVNHINKTTTWNKPQPRASSSEEPRTIIVQPSGI